jgi:hypothetical protein
MMLLFLFSYAFPIAAAVSQTAQSVPSYGIISYDDAINPLLGGWGGVRLVETTTYTNIENDSLRTTPASIVFAGEVASNAELTLIYMKSQGYNAVRACWRTPTTEPITGWNPYNDVWMQRFIEIAKALNMWIIADCHAYYDHYQYEDGWIEHWHHVLSTFKDSYDKIIWEPINEPVMQWSDGTHALEGQQAVNELARIYQRWIDMCRDLGDQHWIVVSGVCWWNNLPPVDWYPVVSDPFNRTFLNYHFYYFYDDYPNDWTIADAQAKADYRFDVAKQVIAKYNRPFISTEVGAQAYYGVTPPPDLQYDGASGYSTVSLAFVQRLMANFNSYGVGYVLWPAGDWAKDWSGGWHYTGLYGGVDVWGQLLA